MRRGRQITLSALVADARSFSRQPPETVAEARQSARAAIGSREGGVAFPLNGVPCYASWGDLLSLHLAIPGVISRNRPGDGYSHRLADYLPEIPEQRLYGVATEFRSEDRPGRTSWLELPSGHRVPTCHYTVVIDPPAALSLSGRARSVAMAELCADWAVLLHAYGRRGLHETLPAPAVRSVAEAMNRR